MNGDGIEKARPAAKQQVQQGAGGDMSGSGNFQAGSEGLQRAFVQKIWKAKRLRS